MKHYVIYVGLLMWFVCMSLTTQVYADGPDSCQAVKPQVDYEAILVDLDSKIADSTDLSSEEITDLQICRVQTLIDAGQSEIASAELTSLQQNLGGQKERVVSLLLLEADLFAAKREFAKAAEALSSARSAAKDDAWYEAVILSAGRLAAAELPRDGNNAGILLATAQQSSGLYQLTPGTAASLQVLSARIAAEKDMAQQALAHIDTAARIIREHPEEFGGEVYIALGDVAMMVGSSSANKWYQMALDAEQETEDLSSRSLAKGRSGHFLEEHNKLPEALEATRTALFYAQIIQDEMLIFEWQWQLSRILHALDKLEPALLMNQAAVETLQRIRPGLMANDPDAFRTIVRPVYLDLANLLITKASMPEFSGTAGLLEKAIKTIELLRSDELKDYLNTSCFTVDSVSLLDQQQAQSDAAIIYLVDFQDRIEMIVKRGDLLVHKRALAPTRQIKAEAYLLTDAMTGIKERYRESATRLYRWLVAPLDEEIQGADVLVIVPDGATRSIPFAALLDETGKHLVEKYAVVMNQGISITKAGNAGEYGRQRFFLGGISDSVGGFRAIPKVAEELQTIEGSYPADVLHNQQFTVEGVESEMQGRAYPIVHLASHGMFTGDVEQSFILTWNGKLSIQDLSRMVNAGVPRDQAVDLVALSACSTAVGDDKAALGLAGVALKAGARSVIASLWNVDDEATGKFFVQFYETLQRERNLGKAEAVRKTQLQFLHGEVFTEQAAVDGEKISPRDFSHPFFWAPFVLTGNWQ